MALPDEQRAGVEQKRAVPGMRYETLTAALGFPDRIVRKSAVDADGPILEQAIYGPEVLELLDGVLQGPGGASPTRRRAFYMTLAAGFAPGCVQGDGENT